ncbi:NADH:flavin oxidoreductase/NADH oxidase-like protein 2 [Elsinoe fawcettii]|nr:NADH:flavin oxidoreductase/NADH oxidase-like protein 2 [Elsinoe fawcettii]
MEYDKTTFSGPPEADAYSHDQVHDDENRGRLRVAGPRVNTAALGEPLTFAFSGRTTPNRFLKAPMTERLCTWNTDTDDTSVRGMPTPELINLYKRWGEGGIGIIVMGNTMISYTAVEAFGNPILVDDHDGRLAKYQELVSAAKAHGSLFVCQLFHPGRQGGSALNPQPVSASDVHLNIAWAGTSFNKPRALAVPEIKDLVKAWGETARLCYEAGFDGAQVHCAHGYLLAQFLSLTTNKRTDEYGGALENRARIVFEVIREIKRVVPDKRFIICVKINSVEFQAGGTQPEDCLRLCQRLEELEVDFVDFTKKREAYFIEFAEMIRPNLKKTKVFVTGGFRTAQGMVKAVEEGACDGVGIGRPLTAEPYLCRELLDGRVTGAIDNLVPLPQNTQSSGTLLHQVGKGHGFLSDFSNQEEVERWLAEFHKETERKKSILPKVDSSGCPQVTAMAKFAYLT